MALGLFFVHAIWGQSPGTSSPASNGFDICEPIRPGNPEAGIPFWNRVSARFIFAPAFDFPLIPDAIGYRFKVFGADGKLRTFQSEKPYAALSPVWKELPVGPTTVVCEALDAPDRRVGCIAGTRSFWKSSAFSGGYPGKKRSYQDAARAACDYVFACPSIRRHVETGKPDPTYRNNGYPSKMHAATIHAMCRSVELNPGCREEAVRIAELCGNFLLETAEKAEAPLSYWPQTYTTNDHQVCARPRLVNTIMAVYPCEVGTTYLELWKMTKDAKWLEAAERIAATYVKVRRTDGTWALVYDKRTGRETSGVTMVPVSLIVFFQSLGKAVQKVEYQRIADECLTWIEENPVKTWSWQAQFEDSVPGEDYSNLSHGDVLMALRLLLDRYPGDGRRLSVARDMLRFAEDQFMFWERPYRAEDGEAVAFEHSRVDREFNPAGWYIPGAVEQFHCYKPVCGSASNFIQAYLAYGKASGDKSAFEKARALADAMTRLQLENGYICTWWDRKPRYNAWINCHISCIDALLSSSAEFERR